MLWGVPVGSSDDEDALLACHAVHFRQELVDDSVACTACIADTAASTLCDRIQFIQENDARCSCTSLVKDIPDIGFRFTEPHTEQFRSFDTDKIGRALIGDRLCEERLTSTRGSIKQDTFRRLKTEFDKLLRMFNRILYRLTKFIFNLFETTDVFPFDIGHFDDGFTKGRRVASAECETEIFHGYAEGVEDFGVDGVFV